MQKYYFTKVLLLIVGMVGMALLPMQNVSAAEYPLSSDIRLKPNETWTENISSNIVPKESQRVYLQFRARINAGDFSSGSAEAFRVYANQVPLDISRLKNRKDSYYIDNSRQVLWSRDGIFRALYYPFDRKLPPAWGASHDYVFDITNLLQKGYPNNVTIEYVFDGIPNTTFDIKDCRITIKNAIQPATYPEKSLSYYLSKGLMWARDKATSHHKGIDAKLETSIDNSTPLNISGSPYPSPFEAAADLSDDMSISVKFPHWQPIPINTAIGVPQEGWGKDTDFKKQYKKDNSWQTSAYRLQRRVIPDPQGLIIEDHVTNMTSEDLPFAILYQMGIGDIAQLREFRLGGEPQHNFYANTIPSGKTANYPIGYVRDHKRAYAFVMEDDALRSNGSIMAWDNQLSFGTDMFYLKPKASHTFRFRIIGASSPSYFEIINRVRAAWNNYQNIPGLFGFVYPTGLDKKNFQSAAQVKKFFDDTGITIPTVPTLFPVPESLPNEGTRRFVYGNGPTERVEKGIEYEAEPLVKLMKEANVNLPISVYYDINLLRTDETTNVPSEFSDAIIRDELGAPIDYRPGWLHLILPTTENKIGQRLMKNLDVYFSKSYIGGIFLDEWNNSSSRLDFSRSDGMTARLNEDLTIQSKIGYIPLLTKGLRQKAVNYLEEKDATIFVNAGTVFTDEQTHPMVHFGEPTQYNHLYQAQILNTPLALNLKRTRGVWNDTYEYLNYGVLLCYYARRLSGDHLLKYVYPIKVLSTESGCIIGEDKIVTSRSGEYSLQNNVPVEALIFSAPNGILERKVSGENNNGKNTVTLQLDTKKQEVAVICKQENKE